MSEVGKELAIPSSALLCTDLMNQYGEASHHDGVTMQARFEAKNHRGDAYSLLLTQRGVGLAAVYKAYMHPVLDGSVEVILTMQAGAPVSERLKYHGEYVGSPYQSSSDAGSEMLYSCYDNQIY